MDKLQERSARIRDQIVGAPHNHIYIDYSYRDGDHAINVRHTRAAIRVSLKCAIRFMIRRSRNELKPNVDTHLELTYLYWSKQVGLTDEDINSTWVRTIKRHAQAPRRL